MWFYTPRVLKGNEVIHAEEEEDWALSMVMANQG